jgi:glycosyltransferase involved in cell wall biosynthesis
MVVPNMGEGRSLMSRDQDPIRVGFVAAEVPDAAASNGLASRAFLLVHALAEFADIDLFVASTAGEEAPSAMRYWSECPSVTVHAVLPPRSQPPRSRAHQVVLRARRYLLAPFPRWTRPNLANVAATVASRRVDLLCVHLAPVAHLALQVPKSLPVIAVLEEDLHRPLRDPSPRRRVARRVAARMDFLRARRLYRAVARRCDAVIVLSREEAEHFQRLGVDPSRLKVVPRPIDVDHYSPGAPFEREDVAADVAMFGDFRHARNLEPALEVLRRARETHPEIRWALVGDISGPAANDARALGAVVTGRVEDMRPFYDAIKVVVVPATTGSGVKTTLLQAWAMQRAVVSTTFGCRGAPAEPGVNVLVGGSAAALVEHCAELLDDQELRAKLALSGRETVVRSRNVRVVADEFASICRATVCSASAG